MKLAIFNGSPRGAKSNTKLLLEHFQEGFTKFRGEVISYDYLIQEKNISKQTEHFKTAENIFIAFPLYVDSVPGIVKAFFEEIGNFNGQNKNILFLVQSGFPEAIQSEGVKKYLENLCVRWNINCLGIIVKPGIEGIQIMPGWMTKKIFARMNNFGQQLATNKIINQKDIQHLAKPYKFSKTRLLMVRIFSKLGFINFYWDKNLKKHGAFDRRFDAPLLES